jgi:hypothetical protein
MIEKFLNVWASNGDTGTAPSTDKQKTGFVRREKPTRQRFNWLFNALQTRTNRLTDWTANVCEHSTDREYEVASGLYTNWVNLSGTNNRIDLGSGVNANAINCCFVSGKPKVIVLDTTGNKFFLIDAETATIDAQSGDITAGITGSSINAVNFCTDNRSVYVVFSTSTVARVGKFTIPGFGYDASWPSGGVPLTGTWADRGRPGIKMVAENKVAVACPWITVTASTSAAIQVLYADTGNVMDVGAGNCSTSNGEYPTGELGSDGANIIYSTQGGSSPTHSICGCEVDAPSTGTDGPDFPVGNVYPVRLVSACDSVVGIPDNPDASDSDYMAIRIRSSYAFFDAILAGTADNGKTAKESHFGGCNSVVFDGINIWISTKIKYGSSSYSYALISFDYAMFRSYASGASLTRHDMTSLSKPAILTSGASEMSSNGAYIASDGRDIWEAGGGRYINRLALAVRR